MNIGIIGLGFVGNAMYKSFSLKGLIENVNLFGYDKYKNGGIGSFNDCLHCDILFLALPTKFNYNIYDYDISAIEETCYKLVENNFDGIIVIKSTINPETTNKLSDKYNSLQFIHNPEFLTARRALQDFHNQKHIVLGKDKNCSDKNLNKVKLFYKKYYPDVKFSISTSLESESMKIYVNCFYACKVQFFTELYCLCQKNGSDFNKIRDMMLENKWINKMHTQIPGPDGKISFGGLCFPKDTNALNNYMKLLSSPNKILNAIIKERNSMRTDNNNIISKEK